MCVVRNSFIQLPMRSTTKSLYRPTHYRSGCIQSGCLLLPMQSKIPPMPASAEEIKLLKVAEQDRNARGKGHLLIVVSRAACSLGTVASPARGVECCAVQ